MKQIPNLIALTQNIQSNRTVSQVINQPSIEVMDRQLDLEEIILPENPNGKDFMDEENCFWMCSCYHTFCFCCDDGPHPFGTRLMDCFGRCCFFCSGTMSCIVGLVPSLKGILLECVFVLTTTQLFLLFQHLCLVL